MKILTSEINFKNEDIAIKISESELYILKESLSEKIELNNDIDEIRSLVNLLKVSKLYNDHR